MPGKFPGMPNATSQSLEDITDNILLQCVLEGDLNVDYILRHSRDDRRLTNILNILRDMLEWSRV